MLSVGKKKVTVPTEEATAKYVPAAAVIRMSQALSGFIGRKARLGGKNKSDVKMRGSTPYRVGNCFSRVLERWAELQV